jgi:hypothetical protein
VKRAKLLRLIEQVRNETRYQGAPVTFDNLEIDFDHRTVKFKGRVITVTQPIFVAPLISTDRMIITRDGSEVL